MLRKPIDKIHYDKEGKVSGVESEGEIVKCKKLVGDPEYFIKTDKVKKTGKIVRAICILNHEVENTNKSKG
jgi:Rab GDP dissociation inhibitor